MANDIYNIARHSWSCARNRGTQSTHQKHLKLFPATGPLAFVGRDILGPHPSTKRGNQYVLVIKDRYSKMNRSVTLSKTAASHVGNVLLEDWIIPYGIACYLTTDNGPQFMAKFNASVCAYLGVKELSTTDYHLQTNGQTELYNKSIVARLSHYLAEHQEDWDEFVLPLTYTYHTQVHR